jgi:RimJ/RimL family protein N-acetyltransferase
LNAPFETPRLRLEPLDASHAEHLFGPLQNLAIYAWINEAPPSSVAALAGRWAATEKRLREKYDDARVGWVVRRGEDGAYLGKLDVDINAAHVATNVGWIFFPPFWGKGYASEAVSALAERLTGAGVTEQRVYVTLGNGASARVAEKAGFAFTRVIPGNDAFRGVIYDDLEFVRGRRR